MVAVGGLVVYVVWFSWALGRGDYNAWGTLLIGPALVLVSVPMLRRAVRREADKSIGTLIVAAFFLKLAMAFVNHAVAFGLYGGVADARGYHGAGVAYSEAFRSGEFALTQEGELGRGFVKALTGIVYTVTGPSKLGGYLVFSWFAFWGLYLFYRAFVLAVPEGDRRRYALLVFLLPSTLFWTSAIGKEAWMVLALGTCSLGAARLLTRRQGGFVVLSIGLAASALCRPHVSFIVFIALLVGYLFRRSAASNRIGPLATLAGLAALLAIGSLVADQLVGYFDLTSVGPGSVGTALDTAERQTEGGGSGFTTDGLPRPLAAAGVLFRPFPMEAGNLQALLASAEGTAMLVLFALGRRRLGTAVRRLFTNAYLMYCSVYTVLFLVAFSVFQNFGILARERVQAIPFVLVLLALPARPRVTRLDRLGPPPRAHGATRPAGAPGAVSLVEVRPDGP